MAQYVRMSEQGKESCGTGLSQSQVNLRPMQRDSLPADKERLAGRIQTGAFF